MKNVYKSPLCSCTKRQNIKFFHLQGFADDPSWSEPWPYPYSFQGLRIVRMRQDSFLNYSWLLFRQWLCGKAALKELYRVLLNYFVECILNYTNIHLEVGYITKYNFTFQTCFLLTAKLIQDFQN